MLTREKILSGFKKDNFPEKVFDKSVLDVKNIFFLKKRPSLILKKNKIKKNYLNVMFFHGG